MHERRWLQRVPRAFTRHLRAGECPQFAIVGCKELLRGAFFPQLHRTQEACDVVHTLEPSMPQLLVQEIESAVVQKLRSRAAAQGISVEEAHRRLLRAALLGDKLGPQRDFIAYLRGISLDDSIEFTRASDPSRKVDL